MFRTIERSLALQFTAFVFLLLMINGLVFLITDLSNERRQMRLRLENQMDDIQHSFPEIIEGRMLEQYLPHVERIRVMDGSGSPVFSGELFDDVPFDKKSGYSSVTIGNEEFTLLSSPISGIDRIEGYVQIAEPERAPMADLPLRAGLYLLVSVLISCLTYVVGRRFAKRSLRPAEEMLLRLERFTQDASHELRTPLAVLGSSLDLALKTKRYKEGIESAKDDLRQISGLVERLLETARIGTMALDFQPVDLSALLRSQIVKFQSLAAASGVVIASKVEDNVRVIGEETLVIQVITNLLSNAIKFSHAGRKINVTLDRNALSVEDEGIGIGTDDLPHIFERFYQADTSRAGKGYGLGLSLVKQIVDMHGWTIDLQSEKGNGTLFTVHFKKHLNS